MAGNLSRGRVPVSKCGGAGACRCLHACRVLVLVPGLDGDDISPDLPGVLVFVLVIGVQRVACTLRLPI